jgi:hypothetical protein
MREGVEPYANRTLTIVRVIDLYNESGERGGGHAVTQLKLNDEGVGHFPAPIQ